MVYICCTLRKNIQHLYFFHTFIHLCCLFLPLLVHEVFSVIKHFSSLFHVGLDRDISLMIQAATTTVCGTLEM